jgi:hypothetical protein
MDYKARMYDPNIGRFIQPETLVLSVSSLQALNRYAYVNNNPVKYTDPSGHRFSDVMDAVELKIITQMYQNNSKTASDSLATPKISSEEDSQRDSKGINNIDNGLQKALNKISLAGQRSDLPIDPTSNSTTATSSQNTLQHNINWKLVGQGVGIWVICAAIDIPIVAGLIAGNLGDELIFALFESSIIMIGTLSVTGYVLGWRSIYKGFVSE